MTDAFRPWALNITATPDTAFDLADALGMEGDMTALSVTIFDAPPDNMLVQGLYETQADACLLYTSPSPRDQRGSRMPSSA